MDEEYSRHILALAKEALKEMRKQTQPGQPPAGTFDTRLQPAPPAPVKPTPAAPATVPRTFRAELILELTEAFIALNVGGANAAQAAIDLVDYAGWGEVTGLTYDDVKVSIINGSLKGKKIQPPMHDAFLTGLALFLRQVGKLSKYYKSKKG